MNRLIEAIYFVKTTHSLIVMQHFHLYLNVSGLFCRSTVEHNLIFNIIYKIKAIDNIAFIVVILSNLRISEGFCK